MSDINLALPQRQAPAPVDTGGAVAINGGVTGEVANPDLSITAVQPASSARMLDSLVKVTGKLLAPAIKRQNDADFFNGMARAAAGEAAKDIAAESPAWANFFGEGAGAMGARAYEGARDAAQIEGDSVANLALDRTIPPEKYAEVLRARLDSMESGDPLRDQQMQAAAFQMLPNLMKVQAQAHVQFNQEQAFKARGEAIGAAIDTLEGWSNTARGSQVPVNPADRERAGQAFDLALAPIPGEDVRIADKAKVAALQSALAAGKFAAYERLWQLGALDALPLEQRDTLESTYRVAANRELPGRLTSATRQAAVALMLNPPMDAAVLDEAVNKINSQASLESGITGANLFSPEERLSLLQKAGLKDEAARAAAARRGAAASDAAAKEAALQGGARAALLDPQKVQGSAGAWATVMGEGAGRALQQQGAELWATTPDPLARAAMLTNLGTGTALAIAKTEFETAANARDWNPNIGAAWATIKALPPDVQGTYGVNADQHFVYEQAELNAKAGMPPPEAWKLARASLATKPFRDPNLSKEERDAAGAVAKSFNTSPWFRDRTDAQGFSLLEGMIGAAMRQAPGGTPESRALWARGTVNARGGELVGNVFFFRNDPGLDAWKSQLNGGAGAGEDQVAEAFHTVWEKKLRLNSGLNDQTTWPMGKLKPTLPWVVMNKDPRGEFYFSSTYLEPDADGLAGVMRHVTISKRDIEAALREASQKLDPKTSKPRPAFTAGRASIPY